MTPTKIGRCAMRVGIWGVGLLAGLMAGLLAGALAGPAAAQTLVQQSAEARMQLDFHVPDAALQALLPGGTEPAIAAAGAAKDANLRMIFIDRIAVTAPDGA